MELLKDFIIVFLSSVILLVILSKLKIPSIIGFLLTGIILGQAGLGIVNANNEIEVLSEVGVMLLMFTIGLEFSLGKFKEMKREVLLFGGIQVFFTLILSIILAFFTSFTTAEKIFAGFLIPLSSTAIVLKIIQDRGSLHSPSGKIMIGVLLFQDLCVVPLIILTPILASLGNIDGLAISLQLIKSFALIVIILAVSKYILPKIFDFVVSSKVNELFMVLVLGLCFGLALLTNHLGFSAALGAFIAGMVLAESDFLHQIEADVKPLRTIFLSIFFITVGMLLNIDYVLANPLKITVFLSVILIIKLLVIFFSLFAFRIPLNNALLIGLGLAQIGEFSFMLLNIALPIHIISEDFYQLFLSVSVISMLITPFLMQLGYRISKENSLKKNIMERKEAMQKHVIIAGFGINGINLSKIFKTLNIPYKIIEINPNTVKKYKRAGENIVYGDITQQDNLKRIGIEQAEMIIIAISDAVATSTAVKISRSLNPEIEIIVRSEFITQIEALYKVGANTVISQDFEASLEISSYVLKHYGIAESIIKLKSDQLRKRHYKFFSKHTEGSETHLKLAELASVYFLNYGYYVLGNANLVGNKFSEIEFKLEESVESAQLIGLIRGKNILKENVSDFTLEPTDTLLIYSRQEKMDAAVEWLNAF